MQVYQKVLRAMAATRGKKILPVRWLDVDKARGDSPPDIRSRCVVKQYNTGEREDIFAATPSLEAVKLLLSMTASSNGGRAPTRRVMVLDIKRAFLYADIREEVYIELPEEAKSVEDGDVIGVLRKAMYGTREAPLCWQQHITRYLTQLGFQAGSAGRASAGTGGAARLHVLPLRRRPAPQMQQGAYPPFPRAPLGDQEPEPHRPGLAHGGGRGGGSEGA